MTMTEISQNPFTVHSPDALEEVPPQRIVDLFVEEYTDLPKVKQRKHTFLWGSRGSGKSFIMRYLTPECQYITHESPREFLESEDAFISVFTPCKENQRDKSEINLLDDPAALTVSEHLLNISVAQDVISTISNQIPNEFIPDDEAVRFAKRVSNLFDNASIAPSEAEANDIANIEEEPFFWLEELFSAEDRRVNHYLRELHFDEENTKYTAATSGYHDFLLPMLEAAQTMLSLEDTPFYILLDDAFRLSERQQKVINTWVANRDQGTVCIKISSDPFRYDTYETVTGARVERTHDYVEVDLDELYTSNQNEYFKKVKRIANRRLEVADLPVTDIEELLPKNEFEEELYEEIREETEKEWEEGTQSQSKDDYISRYTKARLFQELADRKNKKSYAGFDNIVHMSSGIVRYFLEPCSLMFSEYVTQDMDPTEVEEIPSDIQDRVLKRYSKQLLRDLPEKLEADISEDEMTKLDKLRRLVDSLGQLFYQRLHDAESKEPRLFSFTVRGQIETGSELDDILKLGRQLQLFQVRTYPSKEGGGREDWYILNRRLAPMYKLDPSIFQGRIRLTPDDLRLAYRNEARFVDKILDVDVDQQSLTEFGDLDE